jgi:asparaginyl-tRNA synthetase
MLRSHYIKDLLNQEITSSQSRVTIAGWLYHKREHGNIVFLDIRDGTGVIQVSANKKNLNEKALKDLKESTQESSLHIEGDVVLDKRAPNGVEIKATHLEVTAIGEEWPLPLGAGDTVLADNKHLFIRTEKQRSILLIRAEVFRLFREWFHKNNYTETQPPLFITAAVEGGSTLFNLQYFDREVYLTQSSQFYLEALCMSLDKVYCINPSFRAEKSRTRKHLSEFWHLEIENAWDDLDAVIKVGEDLISYVSQQLIKSAPRAVETAGGEISRLKEITPPFPRMTYDEAIESLTGKGSKITWGKDIGTKEEHLLTEDYTRPVIVTHFPTSIKPFYHYPDPKRPKVTKCVDFFLPKGYGEVIGGGQRIHDLDQLISRIKEHNLNPEEYGWYIDLRRYGTVPHGGFGLGIDRLIRWIVQGEHIRQVVPFPRDQRRVYP